MTGNRAVRHGGRGGRGAVVALCLSLAACGQQGAEDLAGFGLPVQPSDAPLPGQRVAITGTLHVESNGCFTLDTGEGRRPWVIWPPGTLQDDDRVVLADGVEIGEGDRLLASGAHGNADTLPGWSVPDSLDRAFGTFCEAGDRGIVLIDDLRRLE